MNTLLMLGVTIGNNNIVGAGSVVTKSFLEEGIIIAGNPARKIGTVDKFAEKYKENVFDFRKVSRQKEIENNPDRWIVK